MITEEELDKQQKTLDDRLSERVEMRRKTWVIAYAVHLVKASVKRVKQKVRALAVKLKVLN